MRAGWRRSGREAWVRKKGAVRLRARRWLYSSRVVCAVPRLEGWGVSVEGYRGWGGGDDAQEIGAGVVNEDVEVLEML